jgi:hypothetical protein
MPHQTYLGKWSESGVPHRGWECIYIDDLGAPSQICEMCESHDIRYVHHMQHSEYSEILEVGCICAGHMEQNVARAKQREASLRKASSRRKRWPSLKAWRLSRSGNPTISKDGYRVSIFPKGSTWSGVIVNELTGAKTFAKKQYATELAAKLAAFSGVLWLQAKDR